MASDASGERPAEQFLHPASLLFSVGSAARRLLLPGLVLLVMSARGRNSELWLMLLFIPAVIAALLRYWSFRYRLGEEELVIREGLLTRNERHVPYHRVQNIDLVQNPLHRLFGVAEVKLETAGGEKPEATISVLSLEAVARMRERVFAERRAAVPVEPGAAAATEPLSAEDVSGRPLHRMSPGDVALFGVISNQGMVVVAAAIGLLWQLDVMDRFFKELSASAWWRKLPAKVPVPSPLLIVALGLAALVTFIVLMRLLSIAWAFLKLHGFRLTLHGEDLRATHGLFTRISKTVPRQRIQLVSVRAGFLHRLFGTAAVQVETAGGAGGASSEVAGRSWIAPLIRREALPALLREVVPGLDLAAVEWQPLAERTRTRLLRRGIVFSGLLAAAAGITFPPWGALSFLLLAAAAWNHARLHVRHTAWAIHEDLVLYRSGWWDRRLSAARFSKIQGVELASSPFDRRHDMASVSVDTAGAGRIGHRIDVAFLPAGVAGALRDRLAHEAARTAFRW